MIKILPDHAHEGECYEPSDLTFQYNIDGLKGDEYPVGSGGTRIAPQVIVGADARETLTLIAGRCISLIWLLDLLETPEFVHPWLARPIELDEDDGEFDPGPALDVAIGGALVEFARRYRTRDEKVKAEAEETVEEIVSANARRLINDVISRDRRLGRIVDVLNRKR